MIEKLYGVCCNKCGDKTGGIGTTPEIARQQAKLIGWGGYSGEDYCPNCYKPAFGPLRVDQWQLPDGTVMSNKFGNPKE